MPFDIYEHHWNVRKLIHCISFDTLEQHLCTSANFVKVLDGIPRLLQTVSVCFLCTWQLQPEKSDPSWLDTDSGRSSSPCSVWTIKTSATGKHIVTSSIRCGEVNFCSANSREETGMNWHNSCSNNEKEWKGVTKSEVEVEVAMRETLVATHL